MFVIELIYKADVREIDAHMAAHVRFLKKYYAYLATWPDSLEWQLSVPTGQTYRLRIGRAK